MPKVPAGFKVEEFASGFKNPRLIRTAPNGDLFVAESRANLVRVIRASKDGSKAEINEVYAADLKRPFGIAFYPQGPNPQYIYIGNTDSIVRYPYRNGDINRAARQRWSCLTFPAGAN
jgi:glucose/arabinose dehydrogenase